MIRALGVAALIGMSAPALGCDIPRDVQGLRNDLLVRANETRAAAGLGVLRADARLDEAAQTQACRTAERARVSHRGSWFAGLARRLRRVNYALALAVENLAAGQTSAEAVMRDWAASEAHRENLLNADVQEAGFGVARAEDGWLYWSMIAASPRP